MGVKKILLLILLVLFLIAGIGFYFAYDAIFDDNINNSKTSHELFIFPGDKFETITAKLVDSEIINDSKTFELVANLMSYKNGKIQAGKYVIPSTYSNRDLVSMLRSGNQKEVNLTFNNARLLEDLSGKLSKNILLDSLQILKFLSDDENLSETEFDQTTIMSLFIPNTYKVYWSISLEDLLKRMLKEHAKFWNDKRVDKASKLNLSKQEVYTLASIVDRESLAKSEKPRIAGVYLNRLSRGIPLQADPTVVFALKQFDLRRILNKHLEFDSPYNTYKYPGLPPGPVGMSSISGIDSVLDYESHDFIFFCAKPNGNGKHAFAKSLAGHNKNARAYHRWLNSRGIR